jgi:DNA mismatch repair protein MutS
MDIKKIDSLITVLELSLKEDGASSLLLWNIIKDGYDQEIDAYRKNIHESKTWLSEYQTTLIHETGIQTLRIKFSQNTGYCIEIPKTQLHKISSDFIHTQTLVNASRFSTHILTSFQSRLLQSEENMSSKEYEIFLTIREKVLEDFTMIKKLSEDISFLDFIAWLAELANINNYNRPKIQTWYTLEIYWGRHPVTETINRDFVSNDLLLCENDFIHLLTWPNMGGKSTYLRQNALLIIMTHMGSYIPAKKASISIIDKVFSRVGAYDNLYLWQSTFMVEMQEIANILHNTTNKSFIIVDEIGRGTSTYDGMSLAWSILKYLHSDIWVKTLFATHYHEITDMSFELWGVSNYSVAVWENEENIVFLRKVIPGAMKKSYGIEVAHIAWIPKKLLHEARKIMKNLEMNQGYISHQLNLSHIHTSWEKSEQELLNQKIVDQLIAIDPMNITPLMALQELFRLRNIKEK